MILILGKGTLGTALHNFFDGSVLVGRPEFDFKSQTDCDRLVSLYTPTVVINTVAVNQASNPWEILTTNFTSAAYLTLQFYEKMPRGQIVNISSTSALWVSYPDINNGRLCYNVSKENLSLFGRHLNRKIVDSSKELVVTTLEIGSFPSKFNNFAPGMPLDRVVSIVNEVVENPVQQLTVTK